MEQDVAQAIARLEQSLWGVSGQNGMQGDLKAFRSEFREYVRDETERRESEQKERLSAQRALSLSLLAAIVALIGTVASLVVVLSV